MKHCVLCAPRTYDEWPQLGMHRIVVSDYSAEYEYEYE